jgi:hypothetical protein
MSASKVLDPEAQLEKFLAKFESSQADLVRQCQKRLRKLLPGTNQLVWDNYNFFVIGYSPTLRPSDSFVSLAAAAKGVALSFYRGATLPDPEGVLLGSGKQNRFVRLPDAKVLDTKVVKTLIRAAVAQGNVPLPRSGQGVTVVRSVSKKQRPRKKATRAK